MWLGEIITLVHDTVRRPDKAALIDQRILQAVRTVHAWAAFPRDRLEWLVPSADITLSADPAVGQFTLPKDIRLPEIVTALDATGTQIGEPLRMLSIPGVIQQTKLNGSAVGTCYQVNGGISFNAGYAVDSILLSGITYRPENAVVYNPTGTSRPMTDIVIQEYTSWILEDKPLAVIDQAIGFALASVGNEKQARVYLATVSSEHKPELQLLA